MYRSIRLVFMLLTAQASLFAQRPVELTDLFESRVFNARGVRGFRSLEDGLHFSRQTAKGIERYSFATGEAVDIMVANENLKINGTQLDLNNYVFTPGERYVILESGIESIYRHSYKASVYVFDRESKKLIHVFGKPIQNPVLSPDGSNLAFVYENNVYIQNLSSLELTTVTRDGERNAIINGAPDWVYEEEFGFHVGIAWNDNHYYLAISSTCDYFVFGRNATNLS